MNKCEQLDNAHKTQPDDKIQTGIDRKIMVKKRKRSPKSKGAKNTAKFSKTEKVIFSNQNQFKLVYGPKMNQL